MMQDSEINNRSLGVAAAALAGNFVCSAPIVTATFGAFLIPVTSEFGWSRSSFAIVLTLVSIIGVVMLPLAGRVADRYGVRRVVLTGNLLFAAAVALLSLAGPRLTDFYLLYAFVAVASAFSSTVLLSRMVSEWFVDRRGLFLGLTAGVGNGLGCAAMPILMLTVIEHGGWRNAYLALALAVALIGFPVMLTMLRQRPGSTDRELQRLRRPGVSAVEARRSGLFWTILVTIAIGGGALSAVFTHIVPLLTDRGLADHAMLVIATVAVSSTTCQVTLGRMLDKASLPRFSAIMILLSAGGVLALSSATTTVSLIASGVLVGIGNGAEYALLSYIVPRYFGFRAYSEIYGSILGVVLLCMGITPMLMDIVYDLHGNYEPSLLGVTAALLATSVLIARFPAYRFARDGEPVKIIDALVKRTMPLPV